MTVESLVIMILVGIVAGWLAGQVVRGGGFGLVGDLVIGIIGALISAAIGAIILLLIIRLIRRA